MLINLKFDTQAQAASQSFRNSIQTAANILDGTLTDNITVNLTIGYGEVPNFPNFTLNPTGAAASSDFGAADSYSTVRTWLGQNASADVQSGVSALPTGTLIQGRSTVDVFRPEEKLIGQVSATDTGEDGVAGFGTGIASNLLVGVALHELTHALGRIPDGPQPDLLDLFRFTSPGVRYFSGNVTPSSASYFSLDGGNTRLADYGQSSDPSDFLNTGVQGPNDALNEFYGNNTFQYLTKVDVLQMEALGYHSAFLHPVVTVNSNDLSYAGTASGFNHFIDLLNFEASYSDLIRGFGTNQQAMQTWYNTYEPSERRIGTFDGLEYVASYNDLIGAFRAAGSAQAAQDAGAAHYINYGLNEARSTTFNGLDYIASYSDLISGFGANSDAGAYHFIQYGSSEHRTTTFDGLDYIASYSDLIGGLGANEQAGAAHFITYGSGEHRTTNFDGLSYIARYTDLMTAYGANNDAGATHYINFGSHEGRSTSFNVAAYQQAHPDLLGKFSSNDEFLTAYINTYVTTAHFLT